MAGDVRQPIDVDSLSRFIGHTTSHIKLPITIKQVCANIDLKWKPSLTLN